MQNKLQVFKSGEFGELSILMIDDKPYFPATECARILGYSEPHKAVSRHTNGGMKHPVIDRMGRTQETNFIPEGDLYRLIIRSKLPAAEKFEQWVFDEVLPSIRKYGLYVNDDLLQELIDRSDYATRLLSSLKSERSKTQSLIPKAEYYDIVLQSDNAIPVSIIAKDYAMTAANFNRLLHKLHIQYKIDDTWLLYSEFADCGYTKSYTYMVNGKKAVVRMLWTQKGRQFLFKELRCAGILPHSEQKA